MHFVKQKHKFDKNGTESEMENLTHSFRKRGTCASAQIRIANQK